MRWVPFPNEGCQFCEKHKAVQCPAAARGACKVRKAPLPLGACEDLREGSNVRVHVCAQSLVQEGVTESRGLGMATGHSREAGRHMVGLECLQTPQSHQPGLKNLTLISRET